MKKIFAKLIVVFMLISILSSNATDVGNSTGSSGSIPGAASAGNAAYGANANWTMWKISVYVGKDTNTARTEEEIGKLSLDSLSSDYYQFGKTYWIYRDEMSICYRNGLKSEALKSRFWVATNNKEQYLDNLNTLLDEGESPGGKLSFNMSSIDSVENRVFNAEELDFETDIIGGASIPYVRNIGSIDGMTGEDYDEQVDVFFNQSKHNWNTLINLAGIADGESGSKAYEKILSKMVESGSFTSNGVKISNLALVNPYRSLDESGKYKNESSLVAWVIVYEPVIIFYKEINWLYHYFAMTASDAAAAFISGELNLTNSSGFSRLTCLKNVFYAPDNSDLLSIWNFASPFFINLASAVLPSSNWFGYELLSNEDYSSQTYNGNRYIYLDSVLKKCGVGFRYQASNAVPNDTWCDLTCELIKPQSLYKAGLEVVTSAYVYNEGNIDVIDSSNNTVRLTVFSVENGKNIEVLFSEKYNVVIPQNEKNLVYFKWKVPENLEGKVIMLHVSVDNGNNITEKNETNNTNSITVLVTKREQSKTPETNYEDKTPSSFKETSCPQEYCEAASWEQWVYESGAFYLKKYGITYNNDTGVIISVDNGNISAEYDSVCKMWTMKSGYGFKIDVTPIYVEQDGCLFPAEDAYTGVQIALVKFPEYMYDCVDNRYDTLDENGDSFVFRQNSGQSEENVHYIPIWYRDGEYTIAVISCECWTPMGVIKQCQHVVINIDGNVYDDWYVGR